MGSFKKYVIGSSIPDASVSFKQICTLCLCVFFGDFSSQRAQLWEGKAHFSQKYILWCDLIRYVYYSDSWNKNPTYFSYWICIERLQRTKLYLWKQEFLPEFPELQTNFSLFQVFYFWKMWKVFHYVKILWLVPILMLYFPNYSIWRVYLAFELQLLEHPQFQISRACISKVPYS